MKIKNLMLVCSTLVILTVSIFMSSRLNSGNSSEDGFTSLEALAQHSTTWCELNTITSPQTGCIASYYTCIIDDETYEWEWKQDCVGGAASNICLTYSCT